MIGIPYTFYLKQYQYSFDNHTTDLNARSVCFINDKYIYGVYDVMTKTRHRGYLLLETGIDGLTNFCPQSFFEDVNSITENISLNFSNR